MPDDNRAAAIENRIDKGIAGGLAIADQRGGPLNIVPRNMNEAMEFAKLVAVSDFGIRKEFRGRPGPCLAVALQAWRWGADPFACINKAFVVNDQIAYESQLIHAIVNASPVLARRLRSTYSGDGQKRRCKVMGWLRGEDEPFEYESPEIGQIPVKNSPLWKSDPDQQLFYFASRAWARRHVPEILLGIYTTDEIDGQIIDVTAERIDGHAAAIQEAREPEPEPWVVYDHAGNSYEFKTQANAVEALRKVLIAAAAQEGNAVTTAWDNNATGAGLLDRLDDSPDYAALDRLYNELVPPSQTLETGAEQPSQEGGAPAETPGAAVEQPTAAPGPAPAPFQQGTSPNAAEDTPAAGDGGDNGAAGTKAGPGPTATTAASPSEQTAERHDPFWDRASLKIDPMPVRGGGSLNKLDWKTWPALLTPRIRQAWSIQILNALREDNADGLATYASTVGQRDADDIAALFEDARNRLS